MTEPHAPRRAIQSPGAVLFFLFVVVAVTAADLGLKYWSFEHVAGVAIELDPQRPGEGVPLHEPIVLVPHVLNLQLTTNTGAVFGQGKGLRPLFIAVSVLAVGVIGYLFARTRSTDWLIHVSLALILAGAIGNLYDRAVYAQVRDMLHMFPTVGLWPWLFNLADVALMIGVGGVLVLTWVRGEPKQAEVEDQPAD